MADAIHTAHIAINNHNAFRIANDMWNVSLVPFHEKPSLNTNSNANPKLKFIIKSYNNNNNNNSDNF